MKKLIILFLLSLVSALFGDKFLYLVEISPGNLADIDLQQNVAIKDAGNKEKAVSISKKCSAWLSLSKEHCLGKEIVVTFRYKAAKKGVFPKKAKAVLRYSKGEVYYSGVVGKPVFLEVGNEWKKAGCTIKFPKELEDAILMLNSSDAEYFVTDIKVFQKSAVPHTGW